MKDLKLLVRDYPVSDVLEAPRVTASDCGTCKPIAKNALTILINLSRDAEVLQNLAEDDAFLETLVARVTVCRCTFGESATSD